MKTRPSANQDGRIPVLFRWEGGRNGNAVAIFPTEPASPGYMTCYAHVGQHSSCSRAYVRGTRPASPEEYASLKRELEAAPYGYKLDIRQRITPEMEAVRRHRERA